MTSGQQLSVGIAALCVPCFLANKASHYVHPTYSWRCLMGYYPFPPHLIVAYHLWCGYAASRADGCEPWHARKLLGSSAWATGGKFLSANGNLTAHAGQGAEALCIQGGWPFRPRYGLCRATSLECGKKAWPLGRLSRRGKGGWNGQKASVFLGLKAQRPGLLWVTASRFSRRSLLSISGE
jgi:hypothetical protein